MEELKYLPSEEWKVTFRGTNKPNFFVPTKNGSVKIEFNSEADAQKWFESHNAKTFYETTTFETVMAGMKPAAQDGKEK